MMTYTVIRDEFNRESIQRIDEDGKIWSIPTDPANSDYQAYLNRDNPDWNNQPTL
jgi:hypothetical protein